eukprot:scaffold164085_cov25-Tisochrysis_lutea.AAC.1
MLCRVDYVSHVHVDAVHLGSCAIWMIAFLHQYQTTIQRCGISAHGFCKGARSLCIGITVRGFQITVHADKRIACESDKNGPACMWLRQGRLHVAASRKLAASTGAACGCPRKLAASREAACGCVKKVGCVKRGCVWLRQTLALWLSLPR